MFYTKLKLPGSRTVKTEITDENVFTKCPECRRELPIDLVEVFSDGKGDLFSTSVICSNCTKKRITKSKHTDGFKITADGIALLFDALCQAGYVEQVSDLLVEYEIETVRGLMPEQYEAFADELKSLAIEGGNV